MLVINGMTIEDLKAEALKQGYLLNVSKRNLLIKPNHCSCGNPTNLSTRVMYPYYYNRYRQKDEYQTMPCNEYDVSIHCNVCGKRVFGHTRTEAVEKWNAMNKKE